MLTIGEFAARSGLSRSALRFYDQTGLLTPAQVDPENGYRRYGEGQVGQARLVCRLRAAELPLAPLRRYLGAAREERRAILDAHAAAFRERASAVETLVDELRRTLDAEQEAPPRACSVAAAVLAAALRQVSFAAADPEVRAELAGAWVETKDDSLRLVATDSYRLAVRDVVPERVGSAALRGVIDARGLASLQQRLETATAAVITQDDQGELSAVLDGRRATIGHRGEGFPDYERILTELDRGGQVTLERIAIARALADLAGSDSIAIELEPRRIVLSAQGRRSSAPGEGWSRGPMRVYVDGRFLTEAVHAMVGPDLLMEVSDPLAPVTLRSADSGTLSVLTMPIRAPESA